MLTLKGKRLGRDYCTTTAKEESHGLRAGTTREVFDRIAREHHAMIARIASSHEIAPHLVEELVQDIYLAIWRALPSFRGDASLRTFVARIATNRSVTHVVRAMKLPRSVELSEIIPSTGESPESRAIATISERVIG